MYDEYSDDIFRFFLPDFHSGNIALTKYGDILIFDINHWVFKRGNKDNDFIVKENFWETITDLYNLEHIFKDYI